MYSSIHVGYPAASQIVRPNVYAQVLPCRLLATVVHAPTSLEGVRQRGGEQWGEEGRGALGAGGGLLGLYPIVTFQYSSTTLYQFSYHIQ